MRMCILPDVGNLIDTLQRCRKSKSLECARRLYETACCHGLDSESSVGNFVVQMLAECGYIASAEQVLQRLDFQNEHSWTALILGCIDHGRSHHAFDLYQRMKQSNVSPSAYTFMALIKACIQLQDAERGRVVHADIMQNAGVRDGYIDNALIDMYVKCGLLPKAREVFDELSVRDVVSWTALIGGYAEHGPGELALQCFQMMKEEGIFPNDLTLVCVLKSCGSIGALVEGRDIGREIMDKGLQGNTILSNSLVDMYAKCGALPEAQEVFDNLLVRNLVSWNVLIAGYAEHGPIYQALKCFEKMRAEGITPDGMSWTSLIAGFSEHGPAHEALALYEWMQREGILPDAVAYASVLKACSNAGATDKGRELHQEIVSKNYDSDLFISNNLIEMYAQSGTLEDAQNVFNKLEKRDICVWNSLIKACAVNQEGMLAVHYFEDMQRQGAKPDIVTFTCLLTACSHARMVDEGKKYFMLMRDLYRLVPTIDHYTTIVDLLARAGRMFEAEKFLLEVVPRSLHDEGMWAALLTACKAYGEVEVGERCYKWLSQKNPECAPHVHMADIYMSLGRLEDAYEIDKVRKLSAAKNKPVFATIEVNKEVHEFVSTIIPTTRISDLQKHMSSCLERQGYIPDICQIVRLMIEEEEDFLFNPMEERTMAFGFLSMEPGQSIRMTNIACSKYKNRRTSFSKYEEPRSHWTNLYCGLLCTNKYAIVVNCTHFYF
ncbi:hypothetical protein GOP47_0020392 [Adiantum capillus-veneris]|uniref:Pentatricopeptide repeat-containing protein n=1 Tax=Adiantum capillus-veneris TaxID=13818 RepID=A0A9D4UDJ7_ADICA|nr:hypothetical protein GOP47_0020392 [Adiantum capillus-veneris]